MVTMNKPTVAAFDFDKTMTYHDCLIPFIYYVIGWYKTGILLTLSVGTFLFFLIGKRSRQQVKEALLTRAFAGKPEKELFLKGEMFAKEILPKKIKPEALARLQWHQQQNHRTVLVSATIDIFLKFFAENVGFDDLLCSTLEIDPQGALTGRLSGPNCRGAQKVKRLELLLGPKDYTLYAYGDSAGDKELLSYADFSFYRKFQ